MWDLLQETGELSGLNELRSQVSELERSKLTIYMSGSVETLLIPE